MNPYPLQHSVLALIEVHYKHDTPEKYEVVMSPVGDGTLVCVGMHSPYPDESRERMHPWPADQYDSEALRAVHVLATCLFGGVGASPRIVGTPDWTEVSLDVLALGERRPRRLLKLELTADGPSRGTCLHWDTTAVVGHDIVRLSPEDADPLWGITRLAMAGWMPAIDAPPPIGAAAEAEANAGLEPSMLEVEPFELDLDDPDSSLAADELQPAVLPQFAPH